VKLLLPFILCFIKLSFAQNSNVQVKFNSGIFVYDAPLSVGQFSNDSTFNQICIDNNASSAPLGTNVFSDEFNMAIINCPSSSISNLLNQLNAYTAGIKSAKLETTICMMADELYINLVNSSNGTYVSTIANVVVTNNADLNSIFQTFNVNKYENDAIRCDCNVADLKIALDNLPTVISHTSYITYVLLLNNNSRDKAKFSVFPNPFSNNFTIQSEKQIVTYSLMDISGKQLFISTSKNEVDVLASQWNSGIYFLNLLFENGERDTLKLVKQ
jgi:hypothetical protein